MRGKRGQVYLIAAIVIVGIVIAWITITNYSRSTNPIEIYNLGEELGTESVNILEYGTAQGLTNQQMKNLLISFIDEYSRYGNIERLYFVFGNLSEVTFVGYHDEIIIDWVEMDAGGDYKKILIPNGEENPVDEDFYPTAGNPDVSIIALDTTYNFRLGIGENFYFIIYQEAGGEKHVIQGGNKED